MKGYLRGVRGKWVSRESHKGSVLMGNFGSDDFTCLVTMYTNTKDEDCIRVTLNTFTLFDGSLEKFQDVKHTFYHYTSGK